MLNSHFKRLFRLGWRGSPYNSNKHARGRAHALYGGNTEANRNHREQRIVTVSRHPIKGKCGRAVRQFLDYGERISPNRSRKLADSPTALTPNLSSPNYFKINNLTLF